MFYSPLRYPGGKNKLSGFIAQICIDNDIDGHYVEPFAGGASVALFLLFQGFVKKITINDKDRSLYAFWHSVLNETKNLCELIETTDLTIEEWRKQKAVQKNKENESLLALGFSTLYLNRTNRSGIINAGVMGGIRQDGNYLMDCRFNKPKIIERIKSIARKKKNIKLFQLDAIDLIDKIEKKSKDNNVVFYFDPPYYLKGSTLYMNHYQEDNHQSVCDRILAIKGKKWIVSYDNVPQIKSLYKECSKKEYSFKHTAYKSIEGKEILFFSPTLKQPIIEDWNPLNFKLEKGTKSPSIAYFE